MHPAQVTLTHSSINGGGPVTVRCQQVQIGGRKNVEAKPNANMGDQVEVQTVSVENLNYVLQGVMLSQASTSTSGSTLTYPQLLQLWKQRNTPGSEINMTITYGKDLATATFVPNFALTSSVIKAVVTDFSMPIDVSDSRGGYLPVASITLKETR